MLDGGGHSTWLLPSYTVQRHQCRSCDRMRAMHALLHRYGGCRSRLAGTRTCRAASKWASAVAYVREMAACSLMRV